MTLYNRTQLQHYLHHHVTDTNHEVTEVCMYTVSYMLDPMPLLYVSRLSLYIWPSGTYLKPSFFNLVIFNFEDLEFLILAISALSVS